MKMQGSVQAGTCSRERCWWTAAHPCGSSLDVISPQLWAGQQPQLPPKPPFCLWQVGLSGSPCRISQLRPDFFFLGAGEVDLKVGFSASEFMAAYDPYVVDCTYEEGEEAPQARQAGLEDSTG